MIQSVLNKIKQDEQIRINKIRDNRTKFIDYYTYHLPSFMKDIIISNPNIDLLYVSKKLGLEDLYRTSLDTIGYCVNDYIMLLLSYYSNFDTFDAKFEHDWIFKNQLSINKKNSNSLVIDCSLGSITINKNYLTSCNNKNKLLLSYNGAIDKNADKNECHLLTYENTVKNDVVASTGFINDVNGRMLHSWCENDFECIDLAVGYITDKKSYELINNVEEVNKVTHQDIIDEKIPPFYGNSRLIRSLPYLMYKSK